MHQNNPDQYIKGTVFGGGGVRGRKGAFAAVPLPDCKREQWVLFCSGLCSIHHWECFVGQLASPWRLGHVLAPRSDPLQPLILQMHLQWGKRGRSQGARIRPSLQPAATSPIRVPTATATLQPCPLSRQIWLFLSSPTHFTGRKEQPGWGSASKVPAGSCLGQHFCPWKLFQWYRAG